ncbi:MAG: Crp/Fnr family transcriptional regulator [Nannocystaceae bacterium]
MASEAMSAAEFRAVFARYPELTSLRDEVFDALASGVTKLEVPRRRALFTRDGEGPGLLLVASGSVKVSLISPEGREQLLYLAEPGMMIAEGLGMSGRRCRASAFAIEETTAWCVPAARLEEVATGSGELSLALARLISKRADRWIDRCFDLSLRTVDQRLARFLLELAPDDETVSYVVPRERDVATIAALLGSVREEVTRAQRRLQEAGILEVDRRQIRVVNREALADVLLD